VCFVKNFIGGFMGESLFDRLKMAELLVRAADEIGDVKITTSVNSLGRFGVKVKDVLVTDKLDSETAESVSSLIRDALSASRRVLVKRAHVVMNGILSDAENTIPSVFPCGDLQTYTVGVAPDSIGE
jgi:hypothetical protein